MNIFLKKSIVVYWIIDILDNFLSRLSVTVSISGHKIEIRIHFMFIKDSGSLKCYLLETVHSLISSSIVQFLQCSEISFVHPVGIFHFCISRASKFSSSVLFALYTGL